MASSSRQTLFARIFAGDIGFDIYTHAVSESYQDLFGAGIYVGKGIYEVDAFMRSVEGRVPVLMMNDAARTILGFGDDDLRTLDAVQSLEAHDLAGRPLPREQLPLVRALQGETFTDYEVLRIRPDGERRHLLTGGTTVRDDGRGVALAIVVLRDVTELGTWSASAMSTWHSFPMTFAIHWAPSCCPSPC